MSLKEKIKIRWHKFLCNKLNCHDWRIIKEIYLRVGFDGTDGKYPSEQRCKYCDAIKIIQIDEVNHEGEVEHFYMRRVSQSEYVREMVKE